MGLSELRSVSERRAARIEAIQRARARRSIDWKDPAAVRKYKTEQQRQYRAHRRTPAVLGVRLGPAWHAVCAKFLHS